MKMNTKKTVSMNVLYKQKMRNKAVKRGSPISILHLWEMDAV